MVYNGCHAKIIRPKPSGTNNNDFLQMTTAVYHGIEIKSSNDNCSTPFEFMKASEVLRKHPQYYYAHDGGSHSALGCNKEKKGDLKEIQKERQQLCP